MSNIVPYGYQHKPPHAETVERSVLSTMITNVEACHKGVERLDEPDFYDERNRTIFRVLRREYALRNQYVDPHTLMSALHGEIAQAGGIDYVVETAEFAPTGASMDRYIDVLKDKSTLRRVIQVAADITADAYQSNNSKDTMARAESMIQSVTNKAVKGKPKYLSDIAQEWEVTERTEREGGLHIGVLTVDNIMGGVHDGEVMVLAGRPGCGKSALMVQMAIVEAQKGGPCFITSLEMHRHKIYERMLSHLSLVNSRTIWRGVTMESDITSVEYAKGIAMTLPIMLDDCVEDRAEGMLARIKINVQRHKIRTIFVDYIGLMRTAEKFKNRNDELAAISRAFKLLAMELNIRVVVLSQLNRDAAGGRPRVYHLRDSGAIEQDANKIVLISFPEEPDPKSLTTNVLIDVAKNREGMTGAVKCKYDRHTSRFRPTMPGEEYDDEPQAKVKPIIKAGKEGMF